MSQKIHFDLTHQMNWHSRIYRLFAALMLLALLSVQCTPVSQRGPESVKIPDQSAPLPPEVIRIQPADAEELTLDGKIELEFDQAMDEAKTTAAWSMTDADHKTLTGKVTWQSERIMQFKPDQMLKPGAAYTITLSKAAASKEGVTLQEDYTLSYNTSETLQVNRVFPVDGTEDVQVSTPISVIFNRPVVPIGIGDTQAEGVDPLQFDPPVSGEGKWVSSSVYTFQPEKPLKSGTRYQVVIKAGLTDAAGEKATALPDDVSWQFATMTPTVAYFTIADQPVDYDWVGDIPLDVVFKIAFSQPMDANSVVKAISLQTIDEKPVDLSKAVWNEEGTEVTLTPARRLELGTDYVFSIKEKAAAAQDGGMLSGSWRWTFTTVKPPSILYTDPADDTVQKSFTPYLNIKFASPMNVETLNSRVLISPKPENLSFYYDPYGYELNVYGLSPSTKYRVNITPGMEDRYGNRITDALSFGFTTASMPPSAYLSMPDVSIFRAGAPQEFYSNLINVSQASYEVYKLTSEQFVQLNRDYEKRQSFTPEKEEPVWREEETYSELTDKRTWQKYTPETQAGKPLPLGFYFLGMDAEGVEYENKYLDTRLFGVCDAQIVFKTAAGESLLWLTDINSGEPLGGVSVAIYDDQFKEIGRGVTDKDGVLHLDTPKTTDRYVVRYAISADAKHFAFANSNWGSGVDRYESQTWNGFTHSPDHPMAYLYTDRPIYRPGQPVYFKGIARLEDDVAYSLPKETKLTVAISNYEETVYEEEMTLNQFGTFSGEFNIDKEATLGDYDLIAYLPNEAVAVGGGGSGGERIEIGRVSFSVAEYRRLEFQISAAAKKSDLRNGEKMEIDLGADYLSGGSVADADVYWNYSTAPYMFIPDGEDLQGYNFIDEDLWEEYYNYQPVLATEGRAKMDASGQLHLSLPVAVSESKLARQITFEATVTDQAGSQVSGRARVTVHPGLIYAGVRPHSYVGNANEEQTFDLVVVDWKSQPVANQSLSVEIVERQWFTVQEQDAEGQIHWKSTAKETPVTRFDKIVTDENGRASVQFTPPKGGEYRAKVSTYDANGYQVRSSASMWVAGGDYIAWETDDRRSLKLVADHDSYKVGDTAEIMIASPFQGEAYALITVERSRIRKWEVAPINSSSTVYKLPITADMAPNAFVSVMIIKGVDKNTPRPDYAIGLVEVKVDPGKQAVKVQVIPDKETAGPREKVTFTVITTDADGKPVDAEVSLALSDLATLLLRSSNSSPIMDYFYSPRFVEISTSTPFNAMIEDYNDRLAKQIARDTGMAMGSGGGGKGGGALGVMEVRQDFPDTAYWKADVTTGEKGQALVTVTLPDNLTTWRMDARAVTKDTRVGQTTIDILSTKPLLLRPQTPRFLVVGDKVTFGAAIHNNTEEPLDVEVSLQAKGVELTGDAVQKVKIPAGRQDYVSWNAVVNMGATRVDLLFSAKGGKYEDATRPTLGTLDNQGIPVYRYEAVEIAGASGLLDKSGSLSEIISLPSNIGNNPGELTVQVASSLAAGMTDGLKYLEHYPYECIEQTISRFLPNVVMTRALRAAGIQDAEADGKLKEQVNIGLQRIYSKQNADGGWGWWSDQQSNDLTTAYVVLGLLEARASDYTISENTLTKALNFLSSKIKPVGKLPSTETLNRQMFILYVLARAGKPLASDTIALYDVRTSMDIYARAFLAQTLHLIDSGDPRIKTLLSDIGGSAALSAAGAHWEEKEDDYWNWNTDLRTTAITLNALIQIDPKNKLNVDAARWLMSNRTAGYWRSTQETAWTLMALTNWMTTSGELKADYSYAVALNGERIGEGTANQETLRQVNELKIDITDLLKDEPNRLTFARNAGSGALYYTAYLKGSLPVEEIEPLDHGVTITRSYYALNNLTKPVTKAKWGDRLLVRLTIIAPRTVHYLVIDDPLPAGLEAIDQSLETSPQQPSGLESFEWSDPYKTGWGSWLFDHVEMHDEKVTLSATTLSAGTYIYTYQVRASTPGVFKVIPTTGQEFYFPDVFGRSAGSVFEVVQ
jgi:uncharacterized protein YfaS (alpha-2-macroglobulin family)